MDHAATMGEAAHDAARAACKVLPPIETLVRRRQAGVHKPPSKARRGMADYVFFQAVCDGCLPCVRRELEVVQKVSPSAASSTMGYTARDFADYGSQQGVKGAFEVKQYLGAQWSCIPVRAPGHQGAEARAAEKQRTCSDATLQGGASSSHAQGPVEPAGQQHS